MEKHVAAMIVALMRECSDKLNGSVQTVKDTCTEEEFVIYRKAVGQIMGGMYIDIMWPIFREHPDLEPESMKPQNIPAEKPTKSSPRPRSRKTTKRSG